MADSDHQVWGNVESYLFRLVSIFHFNGNLNSSSNAELHQVWGSLYLFWAANHISSWYMHHSTSRYQCRIDQSQCAVTCVSYENQFLFLDLESDSNLGILEITVLGYKFVFSNIIIIIITFIITIVVVIVSIKM